MMNFQIDSKPIEDSNSKSFYVGSDSFRIDFKNKMAGVWTTLQIESKTKIRGGLFM